MNRGNAFTAAAAAYAREPEAGVIDGYIWAGQFVAGEIRIVEGIC
jgi:hypothetical protein